MRIIARCGCGMTNWTLQDWLAHWKYCEKYPQGWRNKLYAIKMFLKTRIEIKKD